MVKELGQLEDTRNDLRQYTQHVIAIQLQDAETHPWVQDLRQEVIKANKELEEVVRSSTHVFFCRSIHVQFSLKYIYIMQKRRVGEIWKACEEVFLLEDGPFIQALDDALKGMHMHRQAYYRGTFTGNHTHKCILAKQHTSVSAHSKLFSYS